MNNKETRKKWTNKREINNVKPDNKACQQKYREGYEDQAKFKYERHYKIRKKKIKVQVWVAEGIKEISKIQNNIEVVKAFKKSNIGMVSDTVGSLKKWAK